MTEVLEFITENYVWFAAGGFVIIMAIIGYFADKKGFGKPKAKKETTAVTVEPDASNNEANEPEAVTEVDNQIAVEPVEVVTELETVPEATQVDEVSPTSENNEQWDSQNFITEEAIEESEVPVLEPLTDLEPTDFEEPSLEPTDFEEPSLEPADFEQVPEQLSDNVPEISVAEEPYTFDNIDLKVDNNDINNNDINNNDINNNDNFMDNQDQVSVDNDIDEENIWKF